MKALSFIRNNLMAEHNKEHGGDSKLFVWDLKHPKQDYKIFDHLMGRVAFFRHGCLEATCWRITKRDDAKGRKEWCLMYLEVESPTNRFVEYRRAKTKKELAEFAVDTAIEESDL